MSQENVELVKGGIDALNREGGVPDTLLDLVAADFTGHPFPEWPERTLYRGRDGWRQLLSEWIENFDDLNWETERFIDAGDQVVAIGKLRGRIKGANAPIAQPVGAVYDDFRGDGTIGEARFFMSSAEALEAAGLSE